MPVSQHQNPKSDIEISQAAKMTRIAEIGRTHLGIPAESLEPYGHYKAKVSMDYVKSLSGKPNGKLILVTAISPTPAGEGKTTTTVGLTDALNHIGKKAMLCLREPSLGPSFGMKGGAAGGGYAQVLPMEDINLHFTVGDCDTNGSEARRLCCHRSRFWKRSWRRKVHRYQMPQDGTSAGLCRCCRHNSDFKDAWRRAEGSVGAGGPLGSGARIQQSCASCRKRAGIRAA